MPAVSSVLGRTSDEAARGMGREVFPSPRVIPLVPSLLKTEHGQLYDPTNLYNIYNGWVGGEHWEFYPLEFLVDTLES